MEQTEVQIPEIAIILDSTVVSVLGQKSITGFQRAFLMSSAIQELRQLLTPEYMKPIMALQSNKLGFRTDKDRNKDGTKGPGYPEEIVKDCVIQAVLSGLEVTGNQFNIIGGNMYATKEGCGAKLSKMEGISYTITPTLPHVNKEQTSAAITMLIEWSVNGGEFTKKEMQVPIKMYAGFTGTDAIIGKATRKARAWLIETITGNEMSEGDVQDVEVTVMSSSPLKKTEAEIERDREEQMLADCKTEIEVDALRIKNPEIDIELVRVRKEQINAK